MHEYRSAMSGVLVADIIVVFDGDTSGAENRDLETAVRLVG